MLKPDVGIFCIGLEAYWEQFKGLKACVKQNYEKVCGKFPESVNLISGGLADNYSRAAEVRECFKNRCVDIIFCYCATYSPSSNVLPAIQDMDVPVVVLNLQPFRSVDYGAVTGIGDWLGTLSCAGAPEVTAVLLKKGVKFAVISGSIEGDADADSEIRQWCMAAGAAKEVRHCHIGMFGHPFPGMMDLYVDETKIHNTLGVYTDFMELHQIKNRLDRITEKEIDFFRKILLEQFELTVNENAKEFQQLCLTCAALWSLVKEERLNALCMHYAGETEGEYKDIAGPMNIVFSVLISLGIPCCVEGDIKTTIAMLILKRIAGCCATGELYGMDLEDDICLIGHSGSSDPAISDLKPVLKESEVFHGKNGRGYLTQFFIKEGPLTMLALSEDGNGKYRFIAASGISEKGEILMLGDTNTRVRFPIAAARFVNQWCSAGPSHHFAVTVGNQIDLIKKTGYILGLDVLEVL